MEYDDIIFSSIYVHKLRKYPLIIKDIQTHKKAGHHECLSAEQTTEIDPRILQVIKLSNSKKNEETSYVPEDKIKRKNKRRGSSSKYIFADQEEGNGSNIYKQKNKTKTTF